jgi:predicted transcriptional regulator
MKKFITLKEVKTILYSVLTEGLKISEVASYLNKSRSSINNVINYYLATDEVPAYNRSLTKELKKFINTEKKNKNIFYKSPNSNLCSKECECFILLYIKDTPLKTIAKLLKRSETSIKRVIEFFLHSNIPKKVLTEETKNHVLNLREIYFNNGNMPKLNKFVLNRLKENDRLEEPLCNKREEPIRDKREENCSFNISNNVNTKKLEIFKGFFPELPEEIRKELWNKCGDMIKLDLKNIKDSLSSI